MVASVSIADWRLQIGMASEAGVREENQDRVTHFSSQFGHVLVLADGMGGHRGGLEASSMVVERLPDLIAGFPPDSLPETVLAESANKLNQLIFAEGSSGDVRVRGMGCTLLVVLICGTADGALAIGAHLGDSRLYFLRKHHLMRLTRDHTVIERMIENGLVKPEDASRHPQAGVLTRALGSEENAQVEFTPWKLLQQNDIFVLCSDGLSAYAQEPAIEECLRASQEPSLAAAQLVELAFRENSQDNVSVLVCKIIPSKESAS